MNSNEFDIMINDIKDILSDLNDSDRIKADIITTNGKNKTYIGIYLKDDIDTNGFYFYEVSEYLFRLKDYLGDNLKSCSYLLVEDKKMFPINRYNLNLNDEEISTNNLYEEEIDNLIIQLK